MSPVQSKYNGNAVSLHDEVAGICAAACALYIKVPAGEIMLAGGCLIRSDKAQQLELSLRREVAETQQP